MHAADEAQLVGMLGELGEEVGGHRTLLPCWRNGNASDPSLAGVGDQLWLVVEGFQVRRPALHGEKDHAPGPCGQERRLGEQRALVRRHRLGREAGERQVPEADARAFEQVATAEAGGTADVVAIGPRAVIRHGCSPTEMRNNHLR